MHILIKGRMSDKDFRINNISRAEKKHFFNDTKIN